MTVTTSDDDSLNNHGLEFENISRMVPGFCMSIKTNGHAKRAGARSWLLKHKTEFIWNVCWQPTSYDILMSYYFPGTDSFSRTWREKGRFSILSLRLDFSPRALFFQPPLSSLHIMVVSKMNGTVCDPHMQRTQPWLASESLLLAQWHDTRGYRKILHSYVQIRATLKCWRKRFRKAISQLSLQNCHSVFPHLVYTLDSHHTYSIRRSFSQPICT